MLRIGVIGCGWVANACHGPAYLRYATNYTDVELTACCDIDGTKTEAFRVQFGFKRCYTDYAMMLDSESIDAVCLNAPITSIFALGTAILDRGLPLQCEKPPGLTVTEIDQLIAKAQSGEVIHQVAFNRRFTPLIVELKRQLTEMTIHHIHYELDRVGRTKDEFSSTAVHAIDTVRFLAGCDYKMIRFHYQELPGVGENVDVYNTVMDCLMTNGGTATVYISPVTGVNIERATIHTLHQSFFLSCNNGPDAPGRLQHYERGQLVDDINAIRFTGSREDYILNGFYAEDAAFFDAVRSKKQPVHGFASCRQSVEVMQSVRERKPVYPTEKLS